MIGWRIWPGSIVIVDYVDFAVAEVSCALEVVNHVVTKIGDGVRIRAWASAQSRMPLATAGEQIVMQRDSGRKVTERRQHRMGAFMVKAVVQGFGINRPLQREIAAAAQVVVAIDSPTGADVIEDDIVDICGVDAIGP